MRWLRDVFRAAVWPRTTMREVLARPSQGAALAVVLIALLAGALGDVDTRELDRILDLQPRFTVAIVITVIIVVILMSIGVFYLVAWLAYAVGRFLEGRGSARDVRLAIAWGMAPAVWSLLYRIPLALLYGSPALRLQQRGDATTFNPGLLAEGCGFALVFAIVDFAFFVWWMTATTRTLAEAHHYSVWRALGTLAICAIAPFVITLAAALAMMT